MSVRLICARIACLCAAIVVLLLAPGVAHAAKVRSSGVSTAARVTSPRIARVRPSRPPRLKRPKSPLSTRATADGSDTTISITGGTEPFTVSIVGESGELPVYTGPERTVSVPLLAGKTDYRVKSADLQYSDASAWGDTKFWVANTSTRMVRRYDAAVDTVTASVWVRGDETTSAVIFRSIAVRPSDDHVFVAFSDNVNGVDRNRLIELDASGSVVATIAVPGAYKIQDVTFDTSDNIYVSDRGSGTGMSHRVKIVKLSPAGAYLDSTQTVLPANAYISYPMYPLTSMLDYQPVANKLIVRINTGTFAVMDPSSLAVESYRFSGDYAYTCMALNTSDETSVTLYTGGSGYLRDPFFGKQRGFLNDDRYLDPGIIQNPFHEWLVTPTLPAITDVAVDSNDYVYTMQHDGANGITRAYVVNPDGSAVKTVDLPDGTRIAVVW